LFLTPLLSSLPAKLGSKREEKQTKSLSIYSSFSLFLFFHQAKAKIKAIAKAYLLAVLFKSRSNSKSKSKKYPVNSCLTVPLYPLIGAYMSVQVSTYPYRAIHVSTRL
jgi:hypothetical protein